MLGLLALLLIAAIVAVLLVWRPWEPAGPEETPLDPVPTDTAPPTAPTTAPTPEPSSTFTTGQEEVDGAAPTDPCAPESIRITPATDAADYPEGQLVQLSFTIENVGADACSLNAGTAVQEYEIRSGADQVWRFSDCRVDAVDDVVQLAPATPQSTVPLEWDRTRSAPDTCTTERQQMGAGTYELSVRVGDYASTAPARFTLS